MEHVIKVARWQHPAVVRGRGLLCQTPVVCWLLADTVVLCGHRILKSQITREQMSLFVAPKAAHISLLVNK